MGEIYAVLNDDFSLQSVQNRRSKGGFKATIFIFVMIGLENIGFVANMVSLVIYFMNVMKFDISGSATTLTNFLGTAFMLTLLGGFISDSFVNRLNTTLAFGVIELLGYVLLIIQARKKSLQPALPCGKSSCVKGGQALLFYSAIFLMALGVGGIRGALPALGADQFNQKDSKERKYVGSFFNWFLLSITIGATIGVTIIVWVSSNTSWYMGFLISMSAATVGLIILAFGQPYFRVRVPAESPLSRVLQVFVVAVRNRKLELPENSNELYEIDDQDSSSHVECIPRSTQFRSLDKATILPKGFKPMKWRVCTVTQVEEVKILTRMMPIILSTILMNTCLAQLQTLSIQQGTIMNTRIGKFNVPPASIPVIPLIFMSVLIPVYEFAFVPIIRKITGHPNGITHLQRVGVGLVLSAISMAIAGLVEVKRKNAFNNHGEKISLFWLSFHYAIFGVADMFTLVGLMEFFYSEAPAGMRSLSTSFSWVSLSIGYFLSSVLVELTDLVTSKITKSKKGWIEGIDLNHNHVELFYWFLAILSVLNFANYLYWASWYKYKKEVSESEMEVALKVGPTNQKQEEEEGKGGGAMTESKKGLADEGKEENGRMIEEKGN
ncbi:protein NRT1/ PTR FAMILY 4.5-like [Magnolia sinica]|uniref:protein NRT1/ PTR FAMILY 4.5-like n=1 Tax=Magnolia sinica TaxID=86752 RepID=UPI0026590D2A|nr:protein NRT1/ PTR FAMILY 4.5-like [Magnolia sinica]